VVPQLYFKGVKVKYMHLDERVKFLGAMIIVAVVARARFRREAQPLLYKTFQELLSSCSAFFPASAIRDIDMGLDFTCD